MKDIGGKNVMLTGASRGIGVTVARTLAQKGANLALVARSAAKLEALGEELAPICKKVAVVPADLSDLSLLTELCDRVDSELGSIDILINNAAIFCVAAYEKVSPEEIMQNLTMNLAAPMILARCVLPGMLERNQGHIVNISSTSGMFGMAFQENYCATKFGLNGFTGSLRYSMKASGADVSASVVCPGFVSGAGMHHDENDQYGLATPSDATTSTPQDVANAVVRAIEEDESVVVVCKSPVGIWRSINLVAPRLWERLVLKSETVSYMENVAQLRGRGRSKRVN